MTTTSTTSSLSLPSDAIAPFQHQAISQLRVFITYINGAQDDNALRTIFLAAQDLFLNAPQGVDAHTSRLDVMVSDLFDQVCAAYDTRKAALAF